MGLMDGIKVVELGAWVAGPAAGGILADWGADVIKVEDLNGDPFRGALGGLADLSAPFDLDNRGKRSLAIDWRSDEGSEIVRRLADQADVACRRVGHTIQIVGAHVCRHSLQDVLHILCCNRPTEQGQKSTEQP